MNENKIGIVHGRFQPLHLEHMNHYILKAKEKCNLLIVGITNPDPSLTKHDDSNPHRSIDTSNPFTYFERYIMIKEALLDAGIKRDEFEIVPFPINFPELLKYYVPIEKSIFYMTIFDEWGLKKKQLLESLGARVEVLETGKIEEKLSSSEIRKRIIEGKEWKNLVPSAVYKIIKDYKLDERLKMIK
jgi:nicotinamide mononucleotide adenylyltransferase